ncbi:RNA polymerase sigma factor FliA (plasmid) [Terrisporobacter petrolearius]|uniref:sigma-70 family RNA polymerase sigma factor n=1 Tax=Terrisporobacter petrolearius TaxID=1460447 RepID=UPI003241F5EE
MTNADYLKYEKLIVKIAMKYMNNKYLKEYDLDDLRQIGAIGLLQGIEKYREDKKANKITYFYRCIENEILKEIQKNKTVKRFLESNKTYLQESISENAENSLESIIVDENAITDSIIQEEDDEEIIYKYYDEVYRTLNGKQRYLVINSLFYGQDDDKIAEQENMTIKAVQMNVFRGKRKLKEKNKFIQERKKIVLDSYINYYNATVETVVMRRL